MCLQLQTRPILKIVWKRGREKSQIYSGVLIPALKRISDQPARAQGFRSVGIFGEPSLGLYQARHF